MNKLKKTFLVLFLSSLFLNISTLYADCGQSYSCLITAISDTASNLNYGESQKETLENFLLGHFFIDSPYYQWVMATHPEFETPWLSYDNSGGKPYGNFKKCWKFLTETRPEISVELIKKLHVSMMEGGVENIGKDKLGIFREDQIIGTGPYTDQSLKISKAVSENLETNDYAYFDEKFIPEAIFHPGSKFGIIVYPYVSTPKKFLNRLSAQLQKDIADLNNDLFPSLATQKKLTRLIINELIDELLDWYHKNKGTYDPFLLASGFQKRMVSIHPFFNGNGRMSRLLMNYILFLKDLPPSIVQNPDEDLFSTDSYWKNSVKSGSVVTGNLMAEVKNLMLRKLEDFKFSNGVLATFLPNANSPKINYSATFFKQFLPSMQKEYKEVANYIKHYDYNEMMKFLANKYSEFEKSSISFNSNFPAGFVPVSDKHQWAVKNGLSDWNKEDLEKEFLVSENYKIATIIGGENLPQTINNIFREPSPYVFSKMLFTQDFKKESDHCFQSVNKSLFTGEAEEEIKSVVDGDTPGFWLKSYKANDKISKPLINNYKTGWNIIEIEFSGTKEGIYSARLFKKNASEGEIFPSNLYFIPCGIIIESIIKVNLYDETGKFIKEFLKPSEN